MYRFNNNHIVTGVIKEMLHDFHLPMCEVFKDGMHVVKNRLYIKDNFIYRAIKSIDAKELDLTDGTVFVRTFNNYVYGRPVANLTKQLNITNTIYDSYTHKYLGDYLRFYRDYNGIDLMPLYNCFSNESIRFTNIQFTLNKNEYKFYNWRDSNYKVYSVPIRPFHKYTICIDSACGAEMVACFIDNNKVLYGESTNFSPAMTYVSVPSMQFNKPFIYELVDEMNGTQFKEFDKFLINQDKLRLLIKLPEECNSSIVVLEGEYKNANSRIIHEDGTSEIAGKIAVAINPNINIDEETGEDRQKLATSLSLMKLNNGISYPFADRLLEYLFNNVITSDDKIEQNILRVQNIMHNRDYTEGQLKEIKYEYVWDNELTNSIINACNYTRLPDYVDDLLGYCDKDVEEMITIADEEK